MSVLRDSYLRASIQRVTDKFRDALTLTAFTGD